MTGALFFTIVFRPDEKPTSKEFNTREQIWKLPDIIEHFSRYIPFEPGDMFATGSPGGTAIGKPNAAEVFLKPGDVVECGIEGMMTLRTRIVPPI